MSISHLRVEEPLSKERPIPVQGKYLMAQEGQSQFSAGKNLAIEKLNELGVYLKDSLTLWDRFLHLIGYRNWKPVTVQDPSRNDLRIVYFDVKALRKVQGAVDREFKRLAGKGFVSGDLEKDISSYRVDTGSFSAHVAPNLFPLVCNVHKQIGVCHALLQKEKRQIAGDALFLRYEKHLRSHPVQPVTTSYENPVQEGQGTIAPSPVNFSDEGR